jgi:prolyl-tRNA editing enzyme YbaK/EbsC (Cys-tRNA(Pro) deacylase)
MSKSVKRVAKALQDAGAESAILEMPADTRTAEMAAAAAGCLVDQIAKSILFQGMADGRLYLFITAGGNRVDGAKAGQIAGQTLLKADAEAIRAQTGFAIGGVAPLGHLRPLPAYFDPRLLDFAVIWAAAGTPRHIFSIDPGQLLHISGAIKADFTA